ncbi:SAM-dependent methyltransferase [Polynucleobacter sinensis]|uniref:SAM-dependent methyltransferase n=1 Tax=Polynucleobacter sinensis TaxID=1743157 RepID=UPI0007813823|nr:cyclopropane-fatty-acyl-phospholipid synthase family protein [Polynucleobacter sinensis]
MLKKHIDAVLTPLRKIQGGRLHLTLPNQQLIELGDLQHFPPEQAILLNVHDWRVFKQIIHRGDIGFAESYIDGLWTTNNLEGILRLALQNRKLLESLIYGSLLGSLIYKLKHFLNRNTRAGSKKNIHAHYDLGNQFYQLWLDPSMMYSSALFDGNDAQTLQDAQRNKLNRILEQLHWKSNDHLLEIGCGWGGFMETALEKGLTVTGLTLSSEQKDFVDHRFSTLNATHAPASAQAVLMDYRDCHDQFDGIASIEMFEAVGETYWPDYFATLYRCLKPGKRAVIQAIVIQDHLFEKYRAETDFIQQYVFPGGMLASPSIFEKKASEAKLKLIDKYSFGNDYAKTLRIWRESFNQKLDDIRSLGFSDRFIRLWNFYLMYCAAGFAEKDIDVIQFTLEKPL